MTSWDLASQKEARSWEQTLRVETGRSLLFSPRENEAGVSRCQGKQTHLQLLMAHAGTPSSLLQDSREGKESWTGVGAFITHTGQSNSQLCHFPGLPGHTAAGTPAWVSRGELGGRGQRH